MKNVIKTVAILLCASLALSSCKKKHHTPEEDTQFIPLEFTAVSQNMVKAGTESFPYDDFGVWGIARRPGQMNPYILWSSNSMLSVVKDDNDLYIPSSAAYWAVGYTYDFIAVAPWSKAQNTTAVVKGNSPGTDKLTFTCDISDEIEAKNYRFDLLGATMEREVTSRPSNPQQLTFWHLFTKLVINVSFTDCDGGSVTKLILKNVDSQASYTLSFADDSPIQVTCTSNSEESTQKTLTCTTLPAEFYIIPQNISDLKMYLDYTIQKEGNELSTSEYEVDLTPISNTTYGFNEWYNWNLIISPKFIIIGDPTVAPWTDGSTIPDISIK